MDVDGALAFAWANDSDERRPVVCWSTAVIFEILRRVMTTIRSEEGRRDTGGPSNAGAIPSNAADASKGTQTMTLNAGGLAHGSIIAPYRNAGRLPRSRGHLPRLVFGLLDELNAAWPASPESPMTRPASGFRRPLRVNDLGDECLEPPVGDGGGPSPGGHPLRAAGVSSRSVPDRRGAGRSVRQAFHPGVYQIGEV